MDQVGSRRVGDRVEPFLAWLGGPGGAGPGAPGVVRGFDRTVGDEVQGVLDDPGAVVDLVLRVLRAGGWSIGIGAGPVEHPLPMVVRAASGDAFVLAREAVEAAKSRNRPVPLVVRGVVPDPAAQAEAVLVLLASVAARRTAAGWAVIDVLAAADAPLRQDEVAARLGITQQAVSQRLRTALWHEELAARPAAAHLLGLAAGLAPAAESATVPAALPATVPDAEARDPLRSGAADAPAPATPDREHA